MGIEMWDDKLEETFITKVTIINPSPVSVPVHSKYYVLFHGSPIVTYGRHIFRFPITHMGYKRLVSSLQSEYKRQLRVTFSGSEFDLV